MAETQLRELGVPHELWSGITALHGENTPGTMWASVVIGIERRDNQWIVTKLDRRGEVLDATEIGLRVSQPV